MNDPHKPCDFYARIEAGVRAERDQRIGSLIDTFWQRRRHVIDLHAMADNLGAQAVAYHPLTEEE